MLVDRIGELQSQLTTVRFSRTSGDFPIVPNIIAPAAVNYFTGLSRNGVAMIAIDDLPGGGAAPPPFASRPEFR
jgi:hypothetical protein